MISNFEASYIKTFFEFFREAKYFEDIAVNSEKGWSISQTYSTRTLFFYGVISVLTEKKLRLIRCRRWKSFQSASTDQLKSWEKCAWKLFWNFIEDLVKTGIFNPQDRYLFSSQVSMAADSADSSDLFHYFRLFVLTSFFLEKLSF